VEYLHRRNRGGGGGRIGPNAPNARPGGGVRSRVFAQGAKPAAGQTGSAV
jgi:hypothetical protein